MSESENEPRISQLIRERREKIARGEPVGELEMQKVQYTSELPAAPEQPQENIPQNVSSAANTESDAERYMRTRGIGGDPLQRGGARRDLVW